MTLLVCFLGIWKCRGGTEHRTPSRLRCSSTLRYCVRVDARYPYVGKRAFSNSKETALASGGCVAPKTGSWIFGLVSARTDQLNNSCLLVHHPTFWARKILPIAIRMFSYFVEVQQCKHYSFDPSPALKIRFLPVATCEASLIPMKISAPRLSNHIQPLLV